MGTAALFSEQETYSRNSWAMFKSTAYATGVSSVLKFIVHEPRPNNTSESKSYASFPSGHTTSAFAFSSTVVARHGFWPWGFLATGIASLSGFSRINDNKHYLHDVVGGFTIGTVYGLGISYLEQGKMYDSGENSEAQIKFAPVYDKDIYGGIISYEF